MTKLTFFILTGLVLTTSCNNPEQKNNSSTKDSITTTKTASTNSTENKSETTEIDCDSIYKNKGYKITFTTFDTTIAEYDTIPNSIFILHKKLSGQNSILFLDSIHNMFNEVEFADFNGDNVEDILVQSTSDVRSNWSYYLYLVDTLHDKLKKIRGFEEIKNPRFISKYNLIDNYVMSGQNWSDFYKIKGDSIIDYNFVIYDDLSDASSYKKEYNKAIKTILKTEKSNH